MIKFTSIETHPPKLRPEGLFVVDDLLVVLPPLLLPEAEPQQPPGLLACYMRSSRCCSRRLGALWRLGGLRRSMVATQQRILLHSGLWSCGMVWVVHKSNRVRPSTVHRWQWVPGIGARGLGTASPKLDPIAERRTNDDGGREGKTPDARCSHAGRQAAVHATIH